MTSKMQMCKASVQPPALIKDMHEFQLTTLRME